jgi:hypothetical protein
MPFPSSLLRLGDAVSGHSYASSERAPGSVIAQDLGAVFVTPL